MDTTTSGYISSHAMVVRYLSRVAIVSESCTSGLLDLAARGKLSAIAVGCALDS